MISAKRMEAILETMELLANPEFMRAYEEERAGKVDRVYTVDDIPD